MVQKVYIIDDDDAVRDAMSMFFETEDMLHETFASAEQFLQAFDGTQQGCLVVDIRMQGLSGLELQTELNHLKSILPIIFITGHGDLPMAVEAMRQGAIDFLRKPIDEASLLGRIEQAFDRERQLRETDKEKLDTRSKLNALTERERQVYALVTAGITNKVIALELGISERTVEVHRSSVMRKMDASTIAELIRMQILAE